MAESLSLVQAQEFDDIVDYECRLILVGKTGNGKSTLGNKLTGRTNIQVRGGQGNLPEGDEAEQGFAVARWFDAGTKKCQYQTGRGIIGGNDITLKVVDTPGLFDPAEDIKYTLIEVTRGLSLCCPGGPHAIIFVVRCDSRFTDEEENSFDEIIKTFGEGVKDHLIVVFTHGEELGDTPIEALLSSTEAKGLKRVTEIIGGRYVVFSNIPGRQDVEVNRLLDKINEVSNSCTKHFTNDTLRKLTEKIEEKILSLMEEENKTRNEAIVAVRKIIVESDEKKEFLITLVKVFAVSAVFAVLIGVTGGVALAASPIIAIGAVEGVAVGIGGGAVSFLASFVPWIKSKINKHKRDGKKCTIM